jgi:hypothetical protein
MNRIFALGLGLVLVVGLLVWLRGCIDRGFVAPSSTSRQDPSLPTDVHDRIYVDAERHTISTVTREGDHERVSTVYVPRHATVDVHDTGRVDVRVQKWGVDLAPELGISFANKLRIQAGISVLYYGRYSLIGGVVFNANRDLELEGLVAIKRDVSGSWGIWLGTGTRHTIMTGASYRFAGFKKK